MNETTLPPSPNWYLNSILACSRRGTLAWGAKNFIIIAKQKEDNDTLQYSVIKDSTTLYDRITAVAFCPQSYNLDDTTDPELLLAANDDDKIRIWNVDTLELITEFSFKNGNKTIVGVDWSTNNVAYAVTSEGFLMCCNIQYESSKIVPLGKLTATCLACCPHEANLVAIGTKSGLIYIVDKETIVYKLRGHNEEIVSLSWCPSAMNVISANDKRDLLLASGGRDKSVFIWRAGRDGRYEMVIHLPNAPNTNSFQQHKSKLSSKGIWIAVCWAEPKILLTSSVWGELLSWDLSTNVSTSVNSDKIKPSHTLIHAYHSRGLFCIATESRNVNMLSDNWRTTPELTVWTLAQDRWIVCCKHNRDPEKPPILKYKIPTQGGFVYCMAPCPIETSRIAFGVGDDMLRLWNLSESHTTTFDVIAHWQKIKGKIRTISWFPDDESILAFGTSEGRVGMFDAIGTTSKAPLLFRQYHRNTVYKIEWVQLESEYYLFSCSERELVAFKKSEPDVEPMSIIKDGCIEFSWKSNVCLAVALGNGSIVFYNQKLEKCGSSIHIIRNTVNCLAWHPDSTTTDKWMSPYANYLAVASDSSNVIIYDLSELIQILEATSTDTEDTAQSDNSDNSNEENHKTFKLIATLNGHCDRVVCLAWCPHVSGLLVSGSYDGTAQVWNVEKQELLSTFCGHNGPVLSCMWSPLKPQFIITGSSDFTLRIWDYSAAEQSPRSAKKKSNKSSKKIQSKTDDVNMQNGLNSPMSSICPIERSTKSEVPLYKKREKRCYFSRYNKTVTKSKLLDFIKTDIRKNQNQENCTIANLSLFCEKKEDFITLITAEQSLQEDFDAITEMTMWYNRNEFGYTMSLEDNLRRAAKDQQLTDFLVSLAPNISMRLWREMCEAYAHQLITQKNVEKAVSYLLCIHKIYEAVEAFLNVKLFREAYALARCRLDAEDPIVNKILLNWIEWAIGVGQLEQAAHCYVKMGQLDKATEILARRKDVNCLELASEMAFLNGDEGYGISLILEAVKRALVKSNWSKARALIADVRQLQYLNVHIDVHEAIMQSYGKRSAFDTLLTWLQEQENNRLLQSLEREYNASYYEALCKDAIINTTMKKDITNVVHFSTSYELAKAVACNSKEIQLKHIAKALSIVFEDEQILAERGAKHGLRADERFFTYILTILDNKPTEEPDDDNIYAKSNYFVSQSIRAYLCIGILDWMLDYSNQLSVKEETQLTQLVLNLLTDAISDITVFYENKFNETGILAQQLTDFMCSEDYNEEEYNVQMGEIEKLKIIERNFKKERICMPNSSIIFSKACSVIDQLRDDMNQFHLLDFLHKLVGTGKIKPLELEKNLLVKLKYLSNVIEER